jgi:hypothetical protein
MGLISTIRLLKNKFAAVAVILAVLGTGLPQAGYASVFASESVLMSMICDPYLPGSITELTALTGDSIGEIKLTWTAPGDDGTKNQLVSNIYPDYCPFVYEVKLSLESVDSYAGIANNWWNLAVSTYTMLLSTAAMPGNAELRVIGGLVPGTSYWAGIKARDKVGNWSSDLNVMMAVAKKTQLKAITTLTALTDNSVDGGVSLQWTSVGGSAYELKYATVSLGDLGGDTTAWWNQASAYLIGTTPSTEGAKEPVLSVSVGLTAGDTYYFSVKAKDIYGTISPIGNIEGVKAGDKVPAVPQGLVLSLEDVSVKVDWDVNGEPDIKEYEIFRKEETGAYVKISSVAHPTSQYYDSSVEIYKRYWYYVRVWDNTGHSADSAAREIFVGELTVYGDVEFIKVEEILANSVRFSWSQVDVNVKGYAVERNDDVQGTWEEVGFVYSTNTLSYTVAIENEVYYYRLRTQSWYGTMSPGSMLLDTSEEVNHIYCSEDIKSWVMVPDSFADELEDVQSSVAKIRITKESTETGFESNYEIRVVRNGEELKEFRFKNTRMGAKIVLAEEDISDSPGARLQQRGQMALYWYNGIEWIQLGGEVDEKGRIYTRSRRLGRYGLKLASISDEFILTAVIPRIFTPDLPAGENPEVGGEKQELNEIHFYFMNAAGEVSIKIYDISGAEMKRNLRRMGANEMVWDGTDENGTIVRGGIYIYQVECDGKVYNGTIVVAK